MKTTTLALAVTALAWAAAMGTALGKDEIKPIVKVPKTWDAAVAEGKQLNVPIVVHSHGWN